MVLIGAVGSLRRKAGMEWAQKLTMPSHNGSQQELEIRSVRRKMGPSDKVNEPNLSALCKGKNKGRKKI